MPTIITVYNQKGGVAKTTTALNLGAALAARGARVLLVDLDPQANLSQAIGVQVGSLRRSLANVLMGSQTIDQVRLITAVEGIELLPSHSQMRMVERFLTVQPQYEFTLRNQLKAVAGFEYAIIDCPPALGPVTLTGITAADYVLVPSVCEPFALLSLEEALEYLTQNQRRLGLPETDWYLLLTQLPARSRMHRVITNTMQTKYGEHLLVTTIPGDARLRESQAACLPVTEFAPNSRSAAAYTALAEEMYQLIHGN